MLKRLPAITTAIAVVLLMPLGAQAQTLYRIVGPDGKVTFTDKPPSATNPGKVETKSLNAGASIPTASLPFALRQPVSRYPVTLYTATDCASCATLRSFLTQRGVPFTERTISTREDLDALKRQMGEALVPAVTVGAQRLRSANESDLAQFLDAAGYPATSQLPPSYRNAAPTPLVSVAPPVAPAPAAARAPAPPAPTPAPAAESDAANPAGIKF